MRNSGFWSWWLQLICMYQSANWKLAYFRPLEKSMLCYITLRYMTLFEIFQNSIMRHTRITRNDFNCLILQICKSNFDTSISYQFTYSNSIGKFLVSNIWGIYLQFYTVKITHNYTLLNFTKTRLLPHSRLQQVTIYTFHL